MKIKMGVKLVYNYCTVIVQLYYPQSYHDDLLRVICNQ